MSAIKLYRLSRWFYNHHIRFIPGIIAKWIHFRYNCDIPPNVDIGLGTTLGHGGIGVVVNNKAKIGSNCILAQNVTIAGKDGAAPTLNNWCYIGANSVILGGVSVGKNCFVGALSLVNKDVPDNSIVAGIPAKVIRIRTEKEINEWHSWVLSHGGIKIQ